MLVYAAVGEPGREKHLGQHRCVAIPRVGEHVMLYHEGEPYGGFVEAVFYSLLPVDGDGPTGEPSVTIRLQRT